MNRECYIYKLYILLNNVDFTKLRIKITIIYLVCPVQSWIFFSHVYGKKLLCDIDTVSGIHPLSLFQIFHVRNLDAFVWIIVIELTRITGIRGIVVAQKHEE